MGILKKLKVIYQSLHLQDPALNKQFVEQSHHSRIIFYYIEMVFQCIRLSFSMNMESPLQLAQLVGGISMSLVSLLFAYFLSSKKFQYYSVIYKLSHIVLYMFNMQKLYNNLASMKQLQLDQSFYFFIFGQVSTIIFHLQLDSLWLEIVSSIGQAIIVLVVVNFDIFQTNIIVFTYVQFSIFQVINIFKSQKKFLLKLNDKSWLSITDYFYQIPIVIIKFDSITNYISLNDCNKTSEKFFDFRGDEKDSDKLNKKMSQFILEDILQADDLNNSMIKMQLKSPTYNYQNNNGTNIYQSQRDLKSYLIKKSAKIIFQKVSNPKSFEEVSSVEIISCMYNNIQYEVQILPVIIDFQLSIALQFHQLENQSSFLQERKPAKTLEKSYFNLNMTNVNAINTPTQFKSESITKLPLFVSSYKKQNLNINAFVQNMSVQNTPSTNKNNIPQNQNMNSSNEEKEEESVLIINFYHSIIQLMSRNIDDLIAMIEYALQFSQSSTLKVQIQSLKLLKQEQKLIFDAVQLKANFIQKQLHQQSQNNQAINSAGSNQLAELSPPVLQYHYFDFSDISIYLKNHLLIHGYDYYFNIKNLIPQKFQIYSNKEIIQQILQCCIFLITESCKLKSMHQQQSNMMRSFASNGTPIPQNIIQQNVNNLINTLGMTSQQQQQQQSVQQAQTNNFQHKMMTIELSQILNQNQVSNISVKITNIQNPNILDSQKHSKLATFFFNVLKTYLDKVGILASLLQKQNEDNLRYNICFTILSDCNNIQAHQQQNNQILQLQNTNTGINRQTVMSSQYYNNSGSPKNTIQFKEVLSPHIENGIQLSSSNKGRDHSSDNNPNTQNNSQMNFLINNRSESKFQINTSLNNNQKLEFYNLQEKIEEQVLNDTEDDEEQSDIVEPGNEYQNDESKLDKLKQTVINSSALVQNEFSHKKNFIKNKCTQNTQNFDSKLKLQKIKNLEQQKNYKQTNK
ncbi:transmembrane protein, putative (macronuclear) [Tetrahymena thermophila SB210]|uniref:Transmembrane protein, putative n=1 Tax=Tetrahymena thermophila (strain SB210) TaxID=312017 RepID=I7LVL4_TETTS|nr:transmembrane protein, putative [Tetrahymena thermophila SB210]EAR98452.2 transmembrane protein, putative [Tetrahymena thermophila SB210]|eukprot:XP_001018697.2 transmembrane protein, putative [Tetrahymena thermophila SB210]